MNRPIVTNPQSDFAFSGYGDYFFFKARDRGSFTRRFCGYNHAAKPRSTFARAAKATNGYNKREPAPSRLALPGEATNLLSQGPPRRSKEECSRRSGHPSGSGRLPSTLKTASQYGSGMFSHHNQG